MDKPMSRGGRIPWGLTRGDVILLIAGLARYPRGFWDTRRRKAEIRRAMRESEAQCTSGLYIVGGIIVEDLVDVAGVGWRELLSVYPCAMETSFYWDAARYGIDEGPLLVVGETFKLYPPVVVYKCNRPARELAKILGNEAVERALRNELRRAAPLKVEGLLEKLEEATRRIEYGSAKCA